jgi:hypothetical protein
MKYFDAIECFDALAGSLALRAAVRRHFCATLMGVGW